MLYSSSFKTEQDIKWFGAQSKMNTDPLIPLLLFIFIFGTKNGLHILYSSSFQIYSVTFALTSL